MLYVRGNTSVQSRNFLLRMDFLSAILPKPKQQGNVAKMILIAHKPASLVLCR